MRMKFLAGLLFCLICSTGAIAQELTFSTPERADDRDINFDIIGKINGNFLVYKNVRWKHAVSVYNANMELKERVDMDFVPDKTFNVDFIAYPDYCYMIYQYQKKNTVYCMGVKLDGEAKKIGEPVQLDTTRIDLLMSNKIYSMVYSENKKQIMIFKIYRKRQESHFISMLFNDQLQLQRKSRQVVEYDERRDGYSDFLVDNEGTFVYVKSTRGGNRENISKISMVTKAPDSDEFSYKDIDLQDKYIDEIKLKLDNANKHYLVNSFYFTDRRGNIEGLYTCIWDKVEAKPLQSVFVPFEDSIRQDAKATGQLRYALNDYFIRQVIVKKDGGFLLMAEDYSTQSRGSSGNLWNRWDYLNSPYLTPYDYYMYRSSYNPYYRPYNSFGTPQSTRYFYQNVLVLSIDKNGKHEWGNLIHKDQYDDENDNYMSFSTMIAGGEIQFFFNDPTKRYQVLSWQSISPSGQSKRNAPLKSIEKTYQYMPRFAKQVGARQILIPCMYHGNICFAKADF